MCVTLLLGMWYGNVTCSVAYDASGSASARQLCMCVLCVHVHMIHTHIHNRFTSLFPGLYGWWVPEKIFFWTLWCKGRYQRQMGATPSGLISDPPPSSPDFYAGCPSCRNPLNLSWLGTGTKYMLACIPSGLVMCLWQCCNIVSREQTIPILDVGYRVILRVSGGIVIDEWPLLSPILWMPWKI